ncbi:hypothetical protein [Xenorhabdus bovienii]|nr:hypothetical protein [Xenorhabdus bovienii]
MKEERKMSWYTDELLMSATSKTLKYIKTDAQLRQFAYLIPHLNDYAWYVPNHQHNLPSGGLIVISPVCGKRNFNQYRQAFLNYYELTVLESKASFLTETEGRIVPEAPEIKKSFREFLVALSQEIDTPVLYYTASSWGGTFDYELSFLYQPEEILYTSPTHFEDVKPDEKQNALVEGLAGIGVTTLGFFAPHTREFEWDKYKIVD